MPEFGIEPGKSLEELPDNLECPDCGSTMKVRIVRVSVLFTDASVHLIF